VLEAVLGQAQAGVEARCSEQQGREQVLSGSAAAVTAVQLCSKDCLQATHGHGYLLGPSAITSACGLFA
jgi:hypothetical protein